MQQSAVGGSSTAGASGPTAAQTSHLLHVQEHMTNPGSGEGAVEVDISLGLESVKTGQQLAFLVRQCHKHLLPKHAHVA